MQVSTRAQDRFATANGSRRLAPITRKGGGGGGKRTTTLPVTREKRSPHPTPPSSLSTQPPPISGGACHGPTLTFQQPGDETIHIQFPVRHFVATGVGPGRGQKEGASPRREEVAAGGAAAAE